MWLNEYEVEEMHNRYAHSGKPEIQAAARTLADLVVWTNENSDGWPYWRKPAQAAKRLCAALQQHHLHEWLGRGEPVAAEEWLAALRPIKAFRTRQHARFRIWAPNGTYSVG